MDVLLHTGVKPNVGGIESPILYSKAYWETINLVEEYVREVVLSLQHISESHDIQLDDKRAFFKKAAREYGRSALFGYYHLGVLKALLDATWTRHCPITQSHLPTPQASEVTVAKEALTWKAPPKLKPTLAILKRLYTFQLPRIKDFFASSFGVHRYFCWIAYCRHGLCED
ncbi:hypothetical protein M427DRAFT_155736 [Gonapodya prolifera JEL478]|uniref:Triacylglycerol lipase N-terminal domain-containing protein n=1 Tax=Gonapodya prolifera (strain JEL478) TaxID=1344416 RepID=A0A139ADH6_GONPJ|nr:hypothetical protein M427DRAFT_155736 [Gonapodya prolifera JEL478]|eukprot:KXS14851.1 hypothetical protein M427DRAFT_155736 [Gonapodya prolifera JEL478]